MPEKSLVEGFFVLLAAEFVRFKELVAEIAQPVFPDSLFDVVHKSVQKPNVVNRQQPSAENFVGVDKVAHVRSCVIPATIAVATFFDG